MYLKYTGHYITREACFRSARTVSKRTQLSASKYLLQLFGTMRPRYGGHAPLGMYTLRARSLLTMPPIIPSPACVKENNREVANVKAAISSEEDAGRQSQMMLQCGIGDTPAHHSRREDSVAGKSTYRGIAARRLATLLE